MRSEYDRTREALPFIPAHDRDLWLKIGMAIHSGIGQNGFDLWDSWSQSADNYDASDTKTVWRGFKPNGGTGLGTLYHEAQANGWRDDGSYQPPTPEEVAERKRKAEAAKASEEEQIRMEQEKAAQLANLIWNSATPAPADNPYLVRKQVKPVTTLREIEAANAESLLGYAPQGNGELLTGRLLVVPIRKDGKLSSVELIDGNGRKTALKGRGTKAGGYWATGKLPDDAGEKLTILIGEGVATALSAAEATGHPAVAALTSGNLGKVAGLLRQQYPKASLVILADIVKVTGQPDPHAIEAARQTRARLAIPDFGGNRKADQTDFNDLAALHGMESVKRDIAKAKEPWAEPQPLTAKIEPEEYPIEALPDSIRDAVEEVASFVQAPLPMVASSALGALSLACQAHSDVKRAVKLEGPTGLFLLTIADSGERKSTCDGFFAKPIRDYEAAENEKAQPLLKDHRAKMDAWESKRNGVKEKIRQLSKTGKPTEETESLLRSLEHEKPEPPQIPRLLYTDATPEALAYGLAKGWPSGGVVSAEAGLVFGSHGMGKDSVMRNLGLLNQLWDGTSLTIDRRSTESFTVNNARLTIALQIQEPTLRDFFSRSGELARGTGFLARFLVAWPRSTQGYRPFNEAPANWPCLGKFHRRISAILEQAPVMDFDKTLTPAMLTMTAEAKEAWVEFYNAVEKELVSGGELYDVRDVASKSADNVARLAALFHVFEHGTGSGAIGLEAIDSASCIVAWHLNESRRFFGEMALPPEMALAARLDSWLLDYCRRNQTATIPTREAQRMGPIRDKEKLLTALNELIELDRVRVEKEGKQKNIRINPALVEVKV